jgi:leucyl aminopeptidase
MEIEVVDTAPEGVEADVLVFAVSDPVELSPAALELDRLVGGGLAHLLDDGELKGELGSVALLHTHDRLPAHRLATVGVGDALDADGLRTAAASAARRTCAVGGKTLAWVLEPGPLEPAEQARAVVDGVAIGPYDAGRWKTNGRARSQVERLVLCGPGAAAAADEARHANVVAAWTNRCRDLVNAPPNELTPTRLAEFAEETAARFPALSCEVLGPEEIRNAGMRALYAVGQGSDNPPRVMVLRYEPPEPTRHDFRLGLAGKAITFDAGGLSLKPARGMEEMKSDMGGGGAVLTGLAAIAELAIPLPIVAVIGSCENMPGGHAYRPGDIVAAANGKTIEVTNTDAEGRLVLADCLWHARSLGATHLLDLATLTGGVVIAIGDFYAGLFANDDAWLEAVREAAEASGDHAWPLPLHETYKRYIESTYADLKNSSDLKQASAPLAARFLQEFVGEGPWAHLDIAGTAFLERGRGDLYGEEGATGYGVRLLVELARRLAA